MRGADDLVDLSESAGGRGLRQERPEARDCLEGATISCSRIRTLAALPGRVRRIFLLGAWRGCGLSPDDLCPGVSASCRESDDGGRSCCNGSRAMDPAAAGSGWIVARPLGQE